MAKWRDVKQNRVEKKDTKQDSITKARDEFVPIGARLKAFLIDGFIITTPLFYIVIYFFMGGLHDFSENRVLGWSLILIPNYIIIAILWLSKMQTPGLKAYNFKIVNKNNDRISVVQSIVRYLATLIAIPTIFLLFVPFFNKQKKSFQDLVSNTSIIYED